MSKRRRRAHNSYSPAEPRVAPGETAVNRGCANAALAAENGCRGAQRNTGHARAIMRGLVFQAIKKAPKLSLGGSKKIRRRPTLPHGLPYSTIGAGELNFRVRDGIGCDLAAITTGNLRSGSGVDTQISCMFVEFNSSVATLTSFSRRRILATFLPESAKAIQDKGKCQASRPISMGKLHISRCFHTPPITL